MSSEEVVNSLNFASIQKILCAIECDDKRKRQSAFAELRTHLIANNPSRQFILPEEELIFKSISQRLDDPSEGCRESAVKLLRDLTRISDKDQLSLIMPVITRRLGGTAITEPSEEVRLSLVELLRELIKKSPQSFFPFFNDVVQILMKTIVDPFPKIKKESCECISDIAHAIPQQFHMQSESLIKPLLQNMTHNQYKIRVSTVLALGVAVCMGNNKAITTVSGPLAERLFDPTQQVRAAVTEVVGDWMVNLPDRYSYFHVMIPLLLTSLNDEAPNIEEKAWILWSKAGEQWKQENEEDIKDKLDFLSTPPLHYPENLKRPNLGCRTLVKRNLHKIIPALVRELEDWLIDVRLKSSQLLCILIVNVETDVAQYAGQLLQGMYRACGDEDPRVVAHVERAAQLMGYFLPCSNYWSLMYPVIQDACHQGHLRVLAALLSGTEPASLCSHISIIAKYLEQPNVCRLRETIYQSQVLKCVSGLLSVCGKDCLIVSQEIFNIVVTVHGLSNCNDIAKMSEGQLLILKKLENLETIQELYQKYMKTLMHDVCIRPQLWTVHSAERLIFQDLIVQSGPAMGDCLDVVIPTLSACLHPSSTDAEMKLKVMATVALIIQNCGTASCLLSSVLEPFIFSLLQGVIIPNLVWNAGRTAEALRTLTVSCLLALLQTHSIKSEQTVDLLLDSVVSPLMAIIEDTPRKTRLYTCQSLRHIICLAQAMVKLKAEHVHKIYSVVLKRLDDVDDNVRRVAVEILRKIFTGLPDDYSLDCSAAEIETVFSTLLIHLDDPDADFGSIILGVLRDLSPLNGTYLMETLNAAQANFRNQQACQQLLNHLNSESNG